MDTCSGAELFPRGLKSSRVSYKALIQVISGKVVLVSHHAEAIVLRLYGV